jgi:hypothetical protein
MRVIYVCYSVASCAFWFETEVLRKFNCCVYIHIGSTALFVSFYLAIGSFERTPQRRWWNTNLK